MTTIEEAIAAGHLHLFGLPDSEERLPERALYVTDHYLDWADETPELHSPENAVGGRTLFEHLLQALCDFRCGKRPAGAGDLRRMIPTKKGIWSFHTVGARTYGWCPKPHAFVAVTGALESATKADKSLNNRKMAEVFRFAQIANLTGTIILGDVLALFPHEAH